MATLLLLHSAYGLRPAVTRFAAALRGLGHDVVVPDYYEGRVFEDDAGIAHRDVVGARALLERLRPTLADLPDDAALAGFSLGAAFAQRLAADRPQAAGVVLLHHVSPPRGPWSGQPVQVHRYADDPWVDPADVAALEAAVTASGASFEDHVVPGRGHLFTDTDLPDGDPAATSAAVSAIDALLRAGPTSSSPR
ncbi:MAG: dienelactone hydrolase family protein [Lapillicoccus sp.]